MATRIEQAGQARALYASGSTIAEIADAIGVSQASVYRWRKADGRDGIDWDAGRDERRRKDPHALLALLEQRLIRLVQDDARDDGQLADAAFKLRRVIDSIREEIGDVATALTALEGLVEWAVQTLTEDDMAVLRRATAGYLDHLRRDAR